MKTYFFNILIGFDQTVNTLFGGYPDETISARAWRLRNKTKLWKLAHTSINALFFFQPNHCYKAYKAEVKRLQSPKAEQVF